MADRVLIREANANDLDAIIALYADDPLGGHGDIADPAIRPAYEAAFYAIAASPNDRLFVAILDGAVAGVFQTTVRPSMTGRGRPVFTIEAVQTRRDLRGQGIGAAMMTHAIAEARRCGARLVELMSNKSRADAHRFYERLGFVRSHEGFKMKLRDV